MMKYDLLVYMALVLVIATIIVAAIVIYKTPEAASIETQKLRIATVSLTGIMIVFLFVLVLYFVDPSGAGKEIFDKAYTAMLTLAGTIAGYIFGAKKD